MTETTFKCHSVLCCFCTDVVQLMAVTGVVSCPENVKISQKVTFVVVMEGLPLEVTLLLVIFS